MFTAITRRRLLTWINPWVRKQYWKVSREAVRRISGSYEGGVYSILNLIVGVVENTSQALQPRVLLLRISVSGWRLSVCLGIRAGAGTRADYALHFPLCNLKEDTHPRSLSQSR